MPELNDEQLFALLFQQLVLSLHETAMMQMGKIVHPVSGKVERSLPQAQSTIDLLRMLQARTKGNLSQREQQQLDQSVLGLQMNYVGELEQDKKGTPPGGPAAGQTPGDPTAGAGNDAPPKPETKP